jgi:hypothetical protein
VLFAPQVPLQHAPCGGASGGRAGPRAPAGATMAGQVSPRYISSSNISNFHSIQLPAATRFPCMEVESAAEQLDCQTPGVPAAFGTCALSHPYHVCSNGAQLVGTWPVSGWPFLTRLPLPPDPGCVVCQVPLHPAHPPRLYLVHIRRLGCCGVGLHAQQCSLLACHVSPARHTRFPSSGFFGFPGGSCVETSLFP